MRNNKFNRIMTAAIGLLLSSAFIIGKSTDAYALGAAFSTADYARYKDNKLEFDEIPGLIHEYNYTVKKNTEELANDERKGKDADDVSNMLLNNADKMDSLADSMEESNPMAAASYRSNANSLRQQGDTNVTDYEIVKLSYKEVELSTVLDAKKAFLNYYKSGNDKEEADSNKEYLDREYESVLRKKDLAMATELDTLSAKENINKASSNALNADNNAENARKALIILCGWKSEDSPEIDALPTVDMDAIAAINYEEDKKKARENNLTLKMDDIKCTNAKNTFGEGSADYDKYVSTKTNDENSFNINFKGAYDKLINARDSYNTAVLSYNNKDMAYYENEYELGMLSDLELKSETHSKLALRVAKDNAYIALIEALETYNMALNDGLLK